MQPSEIKTNTPRVHADVSRQDGNLGNRDSAEGRGAGAGVCGVPAFYKPGGFYYHPGANIRPGVVGAGGGAAMTGAKRETQT